MDAILQPAQCLVENILLSSSIIARDFAPLDAHQWGGIPNLSQTGCNLLSDELAVRKKLEITIRMCRQDIEQLGMHERLPAEQTEKSVPMFFGIRDRSIQRLEIDRVLLRHIYPASLATKVAGVD